MRTNRMICAMIFLVCWGGYRVYAANYYWSGGGNDGLWTTASNWRTGSATGSVASTYPKSNGDNAFFTSSATVTLDTGSTLTVGSIRLSKNVGTVTLNGTAGSVLTPVKTPKQNESGLVVNQGSKLILNVPISATGRIDKWQTGELEINANLSETASGYALVFGGGTTAIGGDTSVSVPNGMLAVANGGATGSYAELLLRDSARIDANQCKTSVSSGGYDARIVQDGDETQMNIATTLELSTGSGHANLDIYELKRGTLAVTQSLILGAGGSPARFVQSGGAASVSNISANAEGCLVDLSGGTLTIGTATASGEISVPLNLSGTPTLDIPGRYLDLPDETTFAPGTALTKTGEGILRVGHDQVVDGSLTVENGYFLVGTPDGDTVEVRAPLGDHSAWPVTVKSGGFFQLHTINARVTRPLALALEPGGKVRFPQANSKSWNRTAIVAHSLTTNGVALAKGRYTNAATSLGSFLADCLEPASILVPYVWTGNGDGTSWSDGANWEGDAVPPSSSDAAVDFSRAGGKTITLSEEKTVTCIIFNPQGLARNLTIAGTGTIIHACPDYSCGMFIGPGRELTLDVNLVKQDYSTKPAIIGGGNLIVKKNFPGCGQKIGSVYSLDATVTFAGTTSLITSENLKMLSFFTHENQGRSRVVFGNGCSLSCLRVVPSPSGLYPCDEIVQDGAEIEMTDIYVTRHNMFSRSPFSYTLESGTLTLANGVYLGSFLTKDFTRFPGGSFVMNGGVLTLGQFATQRYNNYFYLYGGDIYLKNGFRIAFDSRNLDSPAITNRYPVVLGGARIHSTGDWAGDLEVNMTGKNGATTFDTAGYNAAFNEEVKGTGGLVKTGNGSLTFAGAVTFTGPVTVNGGSVVFDSTATVNGPADFTVNTGSLSFQTVPAAELESIAVPTANDLAVSAAISGLISVKRLVIGGVPQPAGSVAVNGGTVTVSGTSMSVWQGANGGAWSLPANWTGDVPDGATAEVDFGYSTLAVEASISLDADVTLKVLTYRAADGASLRLTGANALTLVAKGAITVPAGNTLILDVPLTLGGEVLKKGGGKLVVNGGISTPGGSDIYWLTTQKGEVVVNSPVSLCRLRSEDPERLTMPAVTLGADALVSNSVAINAGWVNGCGEIVQNGGEVSLNPPTLGFANGGYWALSHSANCYGRYTLNDGKFILPATGEGRPAHSSATADFIQNGGLFSVTRFAMYATEPSTYTLNGGTLEIGEYWSGDAAHSGAVSLNGGTVLSKADEAIFRQAIDIELGGDVTFTQVTEQVSATLSSPIAGAGTIRQAGPGTLTLAGCHYFTGAVTVDGGTLGIETPTIVTNLAATAGSLRFGSAGLLSEEATLDLGANGTLTLDGEGETTVRKLFLNGIERRAGRYSATDNNPGNRLSGDGVLIVLEGNELGTIIQIR